MILVDTSVWIDHLHATDAGLVQLLEEGSVLTHPMVIGELSLGSIWGRTTFLSLLRNLPAAPVAAPAEVATFIEDHALHGRGLSLVDVHLLSSTRLLPGTRLWARDKRLLRAADELGIAATGEVTDA